VKNINLLCKISNFVVDSSAKIISTNKIITALNSGNKVVRNEDVYNFISYITNSFFINECLRFDIKGKQVLKTLSKFYLTDVGFRRTIFSPNEQFGRQLENIIFNEIKILGYDINIGVTSDGKEIDFIVSDGNKR
jgi:predicted AAA+ superfamily ATPase